MATRTAADNWQAKIVPFMYRLLLSRRKGLFLGVTFFIIMVMWINISFDEDLLDSLSPLRNRGGMVASRHFLSNAAARTLSPKEVERRKRVSVFSRILQKQMRRQRKGGEQTQCIHPKLDLKHDTNQFAYHSMPLLNCTGNGMFFSHKGMLVLNTSVIREPALIGKCSFYKIERVDDNVQAYAKPVEVDTAPFNASIDGDFVRIRCVLKTTLEEKQMLEEQEKKLEGMLGEDGEFQGSVNETRAEDGHASDEETASKAETKVEQHKEEENSQAEENVPSIFDDYYSMLQEADGFWEYDDFPNPDREESDFDQLLVQLQPKPQVFQRISKIQAASNSKQQPMKLNVLMFALDSMSHLCYERKLPKTYKYLKDDLGAAILENYNIVGDATTAAIIPMLTGMTEMDLPEVRTSRMDASTLDEYPLIWKRFEENGYATLFAEDEPSLATFNLRLNGFQNAPTDHYMRPFWQALWESGLRQNSERFCTGDTAHHRFMLRYLEDFFVKYHNVSRFAFGFHGELTHADNNPAEYIDDELVAMLQRLQQGKVLEDTVLIVFGDHGARYSKVRHTVQGKLEERLPMMSFVFPHKFRQMYPHLHQNLVNNTQRLSTPFDIHETLLDILNLSRADDRVPAGNGSISLLKKIPVGRTCEDAGISLHWCSCLHQVTVDTGEEMVKAAAKELMWHLNAQTDQRRQQCAQLHLVKVHNAQVVIPNEKVLKFRKSRDEDQREANFSKEVDPDVVHYQLQIETGPCGALYEATIMADFRNFSGYRYIVTPGISRINAYGSQPKCVEDNSPFLRKFCCCHEYLEKQRKAESSGSSKGHLDGGSN